MSDIRLTEEQRQAVMAYIRLTAHQEPAAAAFCGRMSICCRR